MNKSIKARWVKALLSNKYKQGKDRLRNENNEYCCLGILTNIYCQSTKRKWVFKDSADAYFLDGEGLNLPEAVMNWAQIKDTEGKYGDRSLEKDNDQGKSFKEIAKIIEKNF